MTQQSEPVQLDPEQIAAAAFLLRLAARPLILVGGGVLDAGAQQEVILLAETVGSPVMTTARGGAAFPQDHPLAAVVRFGTPEAAALLDESDMVIAIGTSFSAVEKGPQPGLPAQMIHIDIDPTQIDRVYPVRNGIVGDAKQALELILGSIAGAAPIQVLADARAADAPVRAARAREASPGSGR